MTERDDIIVFRKFETSIDANIVKSKLDAYGIPCFLTEENMANLYPGASTLIDISSWLRSMIFFRDFRANATSDAVPEAIPNTTIK